VDFAAGIWIKELAGPNLLPVLAGRHACAALECSLECTDRSESHLVCNGGYRVIAGLQMLFGRFDSQNRKPAAETNTDFVVKIRAKIGSLKIDDIRSYLQADILLKVSFAIFRQPAQIGIIGERVFTHLVQSASAQS
jgi:hypothetical protein